MSVSIKEIIIGRADGQTDRVEPAALGVSLIPVAEPQLWTRAILDVLSDPNKRKSSTQVPFIRIRAEDKNLSIAIADDTIALVRILEESLEQRIPLIIDADLEGETDAPKRDVMLTKLARAFDIPQAELLRIALTQTVIHEQRKDYNESEQQFLKAHQHALGLAQQVRKIDDQMTASVVPGWLFVACGVGAVFVMMTAVTLFYPELRMIVIPIMVSLGIIGLAAYAWRSWQELKIRASLQENRRQLRAERENARHEAQELAQELRKAGNDPDALVIQGSEHFKTANHPVIIERETITESEIEKLSTSGRQILVFTELQQSELPYGQALIYKSEPLSTPS